jgi:hypothetical protein
LDSPSISLVLSHEIHAGSSRANPPCPPLQRGETGVFPKRSILKSLQKGGVRSIPICPFGTQRNWVRELVLVLGRAQTPSKDRRPL